MPFSPHIVINRCQESLRLLNHYGVKRDEDEEELPTSHALKESG